MKCQDAVEMISSYGDGRLAAPERLALAGHFGVCGACREELVRFERARAALAKAPYRMPMALRNRIEGMIEVPHRAGRAAKSWFSLTRPGVSPRWALAGAAAGVLALIFASNSFLPGAGEEPGIPLRSLLTEHVSASRKSADTFRGYLASAPYNYVRWSR